VKLLEPGGLILILIVVMVIFGPSQLPKLAKMFGKSAKSLREGMEGKVDDDEPSTPKATANADSAEAEQPTEAAPVAS
jgi:sec-independent protein translocase protein TatA